MKKMIFCIILLVLLVLLVSCDRDYICSFNVECLNENINVIADGKESKSLSFISEDFNMQPKENYININFSEFDNDTSYAKKYRFEINSKVNQTYNLSLRLDEANKYVRDFLRVAVVIDGKLSVYKFCDKYEDIYHKQNDPDTLLHFNSETIIFNDLYIDITKEKSKEVILFIWIEEAELYDNNGERYKGWDDKSYNATPIMLNMEIR